MTPMSKALRTAAAALAVFALALPTAQPPTGPVRERGSRTEQQTRSTS